MYAHFDPTKAILAEQFGKKLKTETASFDAYYFRNLPKIHVDAARVPVHNGMHGSSVGLSVNHPCMHAVHMNP